MTKRSKQPPPPLPPRREAMPHMDYQSVVSSIEKPASTSPLLGPGLGQECVYVFLVIFSCPCMARIDHSRKKEQHRRWYAFVVELDILDDINHHDTDNNNEPEYL